MAHKKTPDLECSNASKLLVAEEMHGSNDDSVERLCVLRTCRRPHDEETAAAARVDGCPR